MKLLTLTLGLLLTLVAVTPAWAGTRIEILDEAAVSDRFVRLGQIARIDGADAAEIRQLERIFCGLTPEGRESRLIDLHYLKVRLRQSGINLSEIIWTGPRGSLVRRGRPAPAVEAVPTVTPTVTPAMEQARAALAAAARSFLAEQWAKKTDTSSDLVIRLDRVVTDLAFITNAAPTIRRITAGPANAGRVPVDLLLADGTPAGRTVRLWMEIKQYLPMVVARTPIQRGRMITASNLWIEKRELRPDGRPPITRLDDLVGQRANRTIGIGQSADGSWIKQAPLVRSGDTVLVTQKGNGWTITLPGRARSTGALGETVEIENSASRKRFTARVVGLKKVEVIQ